MAEQIRTQWHKVLPLIEADEVYVTAPVNGQARHWRNFSPRAELAKGLIDQITAGVPKFVVDRDLLVIAAGENYQQSLLDMKRMGLLRLPFPAVLVEFDTNDVPSQTRPRMAVLLRDNTYTELMPWEEDNPYRQRFVADCAIYGMIFRIHHDEGGHYLVISPGVLSVDLVEDNDGQPQIKAMCDCTAILQQGPMLNQIIKDTYIKDCVWVWKALCTALLLTNTEGVAKEVITCERINRKRRNSGKPLVPSHTYLHIGRVYKSATSQEATEYIPRKSPIPHWRRGHLKTVRHGLKREQVKTVFIYPRLVAAGATDPEPSMAKEYHISK